MVDYNATTSDVAAALHVKPTTVRRYAANGVIPCVTTPGGHRRFNLAKVIQAIERSSTAMNTHPTSHNPSSVTEDGSDIFDIPFTPAQRPVVRSVTIVTAPPRRRATRIYDTAEDVALAAEDMTVV